MTINYDREHDYIIQDLAETLAAIDGIHLYLGLEQKDYLQLNPAQKIKLLEKAADKILVDLQYNHQLLVGSRAEITFLEDKGKIKISCGDKRIFLVNLLEH